MYLLFLISLFLGCICFLWRIFSLPLFNTTITLPSLYILDTLSFAFNNNLIHPSNIEPSARHIYIKNSMPRLKVSEQDISFSAVKIFNKLPYELRKTFKDGNIAVFFNMLKQFLITNICYDLREIGLE